MSQIKLGDLVVDVVLKDIKNVHLSVYPPRGSVRISAPKRMSQRMKTRWGSCNQEARTIRLNTELAKKPPECLDPHQRLPYREQLRNRFLELRPIPLFDKRFPRSCSRRITSSSLR